MNMYSALRYSAAPARNTPRGKPPAPSPTVVGKWVVALALLLGPGARQLQAADLIRSRASGIIGESARRALERVVGDRSGRDAAQGRDRQETTPRNGETSTPNRSRSRSSTPIPTGPPPVSGGHPAPSRGTVPGPRAGISDQLGCEVRYATLSDGTHLLMNFSYPEQRDVTLPDLDLRVAQLLLNEPVPLPTSLGSEFQMIAFRTQEQGLEASATALLRRQRAYFELPNEFARRDFLTAITPSVLDELAAIRGSVPARCLFVGALAGEYNFREGSFYCDMRTGGVKIVAGGQCFDPQRIRCAEQAARRLASERPAKGSSAFLGFALLGSGKLLRAGETDALLRDYAGSSSGLVLKLDKVETFVVRAQYVRRDLSGTPTIELFERVDFEP